MFDAIKDYKVLVIGDAIIDEYCYVTPLNKSPKENLIPTEFVRTEIFHGGVEAAARHLETFCKVEVRTGKTATIKRRFVDETYLRKLFEVQIEVENGNGADAEYGDYDMVIVTDFGHGYITRERIFRLEIDSKFTAVNAQTNSANLGFNLITKYPTAHYVVIDEPEARLAAHDKHSPIEQVMRKLSSGYLSMVVTHGSHGAYGLDKTGFYHVPAFTDRVVDTMGAGDAFFVITAPLAKAGVPMPELLRIGNAAGAIKTQIVGHREPVTREKLEQFLSKSR